MKLIEQIDELKQIRADLDPELKIGFVPTMGYLHQGHLSLVEASCRACDITIVSIFVNPSQFGPKEDLSAYPRDLKRDLELLSAYAVDYVFYPQASQIYPAGYKTWVEVSDLSSRLCGASRPGHFRGVATIVLKLINLVRPHSMYMGIKDYQQTVVLAKMIEDLHLDTRIIACPIVREADGLAMSSRNSYLDAEQRNRALCLSQAIKVVQQAFTGGVQEADALQDIAVEIIAASAQVDYVQIVDPHLLAPIQTAQADSRIIMAAFVDKVRLIDNAAVGERII